MDFIKAIARIFSGSESEDVQNNNEPTQNTSEEIKKLPLGDPKRDYYSQENPNGRIIKLGTPQINNPYFSGKVYE